MAERRINNDNAIVDIAGRWIRDDELDSAASDAIVKVLQRDKEKLETFLVAMAERKVLSIIKMLQILDVLEDEALTSTERWRGASNMELIRMIQRIQNEINVGLQFIRDTVTEGQTNTKGAIGILINQQNNIVERDPTSVSSVTALSPGRREAIRHALDAVLKATDGNSSGNNGKS